ncbi:MAG: helix-turn-helix domain-containing protein [Desulfitobacteriia bacterium]|jgi:AraC-like DNA-binding protein
MDKVEANRELLEELTNLRASEAFFRRIVELLPLPMEVVSPDGTALMVNQALLDMSGIPSAELIVGKYNILQDPSVEEGGFKDNLLRAFKGETVHFTDIKVPIRQLEDVYGVKNDEVISVFQDIVIFPLLNDKGETEEVVVLFKEQRSYNVTKNINQSIKYLKENYQHEYCLEDVAKAANLSPYHFIRVFKSQTGKTPYEFLLDLKLQKAKEMLIDSTKTITEICSELGFSSPSYFAAVFNKNIGESPKVYRQNHSEDNNSKSNSRPISE